MVEEEEEGEVEEDEEEDEDEGKVCFAGRQLLFICCFVLSHI